MTETARVPTLEAFEALERRVVGLEERLAGVRERWLTIAEAAEYTGRTAKSIRYLIDQGRIPAHKVEGRWTLSTRELDEWIRAQ